MVGVDAERGLVAAFTGVLGRSVGSDEGSFAVHYCCHDLGVELFEEGFDAGVLARGEVVGPPFTGFPELGELLEGWDLLAPHWTIDLGRSLFRATEEDEAGDVPGFAQGLTGSALGRVLVEEDIAPEDLHDAFPEVVFRVRSDGSLLDALRVVTGIFRGPEGYLPAPVPGDVVPRWSEALAEIPDEGLRGHLSGLFRTEQAARSDGAFYLGAEDPSGGVLADPVVAAWRVGEGQAWYAVTRVR